ncbi:MAG: family transposase orfB [Nitrospira sp.]|jgi:transposase InsO family protein|nr:family transposase orfB [Nitrospira sp.]
MRDNNLLAVQPRAFVVTTDSDHVLEVALNLASRLTLTGMNQLWVSDITYIRLRAEFVYLAVVLDAYSRKVVGWALDRTLAARLPIAALKHALAERHPSPGLVHHSDRGVQYASEDYVALLRTHRIIPSMSRPANPYDNASCESFMKTLKREEIYANTYRDLDHLRVHIAAFIEQYYNRDRLHSALGYYSPEEFEQAARSVTTTTGATMQFFGPRALARRHHQAGIRRKQQTWCEEQHSLNDQVCLFQTVSTEGFTPNHCAKFVLKSFKNYRLYSNLSIH